jgi:hypothetical protein
MLCTPINPMVLLIIIPIFYGYLFGNIAYFQTNPYIEHTSIADWDGLSHFSWWFFLHLCLKMLRNVKTSEKTTRSVRTLGLRTLKIPPWHIFSHNNYQHHFLTRITISLDTLWSPDVAGWNFPPPFSWMSSPFKPPFFGDFTLVNGVNQKKIDPACHGNVNAWLEGFPSKNRTAWISWWISYSSNSFCTIYHYIILKYREDMGRCW